MVNKQLNVHEVYITEQLLQTNFTFQFRYQYFLLAFNIARLKLDIES